MIGTRSRRWSIASGILVVLLLVASFVVMGQSPRENAPTTASMSFYATHHSTQMLASYLTLLAVMVYLVFIVGLRAGLYGGETTEGAAVNVGLAAGITFAGMTVVGYGVDVILAATAASGSPQVFQAVRAVEGAVIGISDLPLGVSLAAFAIAMIATRRLPRWLGWFGLLPTIALLAGSFAPIASPLGGIGFLGFLLFLVWTLTTGIVALRGERRELPASRQPEGVMPTTPVLR